MEHVELRLRICRQRYGIYAALLVLCVQRGQRDGDDQYVSVSQFLTDFKKSVACVWPVSVNIVRQCFAMKTHKTQKIMAPVTKCALFFC